MTEQIAEMRYLMQIIADKFINHPVLMLEYAIVLAVLVVTYIPCIKLSAKVEYYCGWERKRDIAKSRGHELKAKLIKAHNGSINYGPDNPGHRASGVYEYTLNGKTKHYKAMFSNGIHPPTELTLYYIDNPKRVFSVSEYRGQELLRSIPWLLVAALPWVAAGTMVILLGISLPE